jgi:hypothetical protein
MRGELLDADEAIEASVIVIELPDLRMSTISKN